MTRKRLNPSRRRAQGGTPDTNHRDALGVVVKRLRKERGWTLAEAGRRCGLAISTLSKVENGLLSLTFDNAKTVQVAVAGFRGYAAIRWQEMATAAVAAVVPMIVFAGIAQRFIVKGLTFGAVK